MPDKPTRFYSTTGLLACFAVTCLCTGGPAWAALLLPFVNNIAGNVASDHFSRLFNLTGLPFFGKKEKKPPPQAALRQALIVAVGKALEQMSDESQDNYGKESISGLRKGWLKRAENELEQAPPELSEWSYLLDGHSKDPQFNLLNALHIELYGPNDNYGDNEFIRLFKTRFPEYLSNHFQQALADNHDAWVGWQVKLLNNLREMLTGLAAGQEKILETLSKLPELNAANFEKQEATFKAELQQVAKDLNLILTKLEDVEKKVDTYGKEHSEKLDAILHFTKSPEPASIANIISRLRAASRSCHRNFTGEGGRFQHLKISDAIFSGIASGGGTDREAMLQTEVRQDGEKLPLRASLENLWQMDSPHALLEGTGGMGKTVSLVHLWEKLLKDDGKSPVPMFIQLNEYNNATENEKENFILHTARQYYGKAEGLEALMAAAPENGSPHILLLLDGFNEVTGDAKAKEKLLKEINRLRNRERYKGLQILLTSRYVSDEQRPDLDLRKSYSWDNFSLLQLQPLSDRQITAYLGRPMPDNRQLQDLLRNPMMLTLYAGDCELPDSLRKMGDFKEVTTAGELLWNVEMVQRVKTGGQYATGKTELALRRCVLEHLLPHLAWHMYREGIFFIEKKNLTGVLGTAMAAICCDDFFETFPALDDPGLESLLQNPNRHLFKKIADEIACSYLTLLVREADNYRFLHQHFRDYFAARHVCNQVELAIAVQEVPAVLSEKPLDIYLRELLGQVTGEHRIRPEVASLPLTVLSRCLPVLQNKFEEDETGYAAWNIVKTWADTRPSLAGADLSRLDLRKIPFNGLPLSAHHGKYYLPARFDGSLLTGRQMLFEGHSEMVKSACYSPDGQKVLSASSDNSIKEWSVETGACLQTFAGHRSGVNSAFYSPDGKKVLSASSDNSIKEWSVETGACLQTFSGHSSGVFSACYSPDGKKVLSASHDKSIKIWSVETGACLQTFSGHSLVVSSACFSPDGQKVLSASHDKSIKIWSVETGACLQTFSGHSSLVNSACFSPDGQKALSASWDGSVKEWSVETGACLQTFSGHSSVVWSACYSPACPDDPVGGQKVLSASSDNSVKEWSVQTGACLQTFPGHSSVVLSACYSPDGKKALSASHDKSVKEWSVETGACLQTFSGHSSQVNSACYSPACPDDPVGGQKVLSASSDNSVKEWSVQTGACLQTFPGHSSVVWSACYSPDGQKVLSASWDGSVKEWSVETGACLQTFSGHSSQVNSACYSPACPDDPVGGQKALSASSDNSIKEWSVETGACLQTFSGHSSVVWSACYSPDGKKVLSASHDKSVKEWSVETGACLQTFSGHSSQVNSACYSPDGQKVLSASADNSVKEWSVETGACLQTFSGHSSLVWSAHYSPDGKKVLSASNDGSIKEWSVQTGACLQTFSGHSSSVNSACYSPDGKKVLSASPDGSIKEWSVKTGACLQTFQNEVGLQLQGCDFRQLHPSAVFTEEEKERLHRYGAIFDDGDEKRWKQAVEEAYLVGA